MKVRRHQIFTLFLILTFSFRLQVMSMPIFIMCAKDVFIGHLPLMRKIVYKRGMYTSDQMRLLITHGGDTVHTQSVLSASDA